MQTNKKNITFFMAPMLVITGVFLFYPFIRSIVKSFYHTDGFFSSTFAGFDNYVRLWQDEVVRISTINTLELMLLAVIFEIGIGLILAVLVDSIRHGQGFFRTTFFFPVVISGAAIGLLFTLIYGYNFGMLNAILESLGFDRVVWITEKSSLIAVAIPTIWQYVGFYFLILLTSISKIPDSFYEAAKLEGVTGFKRTLYITIPLIWSDIKITIILAITGSLKVFELVYIITQGGPFNSSQVLGTYMYRKAFTDQAVGYGSTIAVFIVILGVIISMVINRLLKKEEVSY